MSSQNIIVAKARQPSAQAYYAAGIDDIIEGAKKWRLWMHLARLDIRARYRRTVIGPLWTTLSAAVLILALGIVYSFLWHVEARVFLPYFAAGYSTWLFFTTAINEGAMAFSGNASIINSIRLPFSLHIFRLIARNIMIFFHIIIVYVLVLIWFRIFPDPKALLLLPIGFFLFVLNLFWLGLLLATVCSRYRDVTQVVTNFIQVAFFITPIFWQVELLNPRPMVKLLLADLNPVYHLIELIRSPLLGRVPGALTFAVTSITAVAGLLLSVHVFSRYRGRIAFWI
jgi:ABC-type polysaccharide/polyol phosphate export permease